MATPPDNRPHFPEVGDERTLLDNFLEFHRATLLWKCAELTDEQLRRRSVRSSVLSLLGLVRHMVDVELGWFVFGYGGEDREPVYYLVDGVDSDFDDVDTADVRDAFDQYTKAIDRARAAVAGASLDDEFTSGRTGKTFNLRWVYLHMIEEYARHNGHADLLREAIDGATGE